MTRGLRLLNFTGEIGFFEKNYAFFVEKTVYGKVRI